MKPMGTLQRQRGPCACCDGNGRRICQRALKKRARQQAQRAIKREVRA